METKHIVIPILVGFVCLAAGVGLGYWYQSMQGGIVAPVVSTQGVPQVVKDLSSKVVPSIAAYGAISKIGNNNVTLSFQGDSILVPINSDAKIYAFFPNPAAKPGTNNATVSKQITFAELKIGDNLSVNIKVTPAGQLQGFSVIVLPPPAVSTPVAPATPAK